MILTMLLEVRILIGSEEKNWQLLRGMLDPP